MTASNQTAAVGVHTPTPWVAAAKPSSIVGWPIVAQDGRLIANVNYVQHSNIDPKVPGDAAFNRESAANAALIVRAVNSHAIYEQALKRIERVLGGASNGTIEHEAALCARAALQQAEAGGHE